MDHQVRLEQMHRTNPASGVLPMDLNSDNESHVNPDERDERTNAAHEFPAAPSQLESCIVCDNGETHHAQFRIINVEPDCDGHVQSLLQRRKGVWCYHFVATLTDGTITIPALVLGDVGNDIFGMLAEDLEYTPQPEGRALLSNIWQADWEGTIECRILGNERYFFIQSIQQIVGVVVLKMVDDADLRYH